MSEERPPPNLDAARLHSPLERILRPVVRLCIRAGLTFPALTQLLRALYVNVAEHEFALPGKEQTDSRVSLLTGIHRKEVARLRGEGAPVHTVPAAVSRTSRIVAHWLASTDFTDEEGQPLALPRTASDGRPSFERLVEEVTRDVRPRAILDEWLDRGVAVIDADGNVTLREAAFVPRGDEELRLYYFGRNLHDHAAAAAANVAAAAPRFFERAVHYDGLSPELAARLEAKARILATKALQAANREAHVACESDGGGGSRWNFGIYIYREDADARAREEGV